MISDIDHYIALIAMAKMGVPATQTSMVWGDGTHVLLASQAVVDACLAHLAFGADSQQEINAAYFAAMTERIMNTEAMEITTFRLAKGVTMSGFIATNQDVDAWLKQQPGFILRRICQGADGLVTDMLLWQSVEDGERAATGIVTVLARSPVHAAIDQTSVNWRVTPCRHSVDR